MLYIKGHKIIKGYVGNTPVSHVGFGKSGLIKIKSENGGSDYPNNLIAKYTANASGVLPIFNSGYQYTVNETKSNGVYIVEISSDSDFTSCNFSGKTQLLTVDYLKVTDKVISMENTFNGCKSLTKVNTSNFDTSNVINMVNMFRNCQSLILLDASNFNTSNVTDMRCMFDLCSRLVSLDLSNWDVSKVKNMGAMFGTCSSLKELNVSNWKTDSLIKADWMFNKCLNLQKLDLSSWNVNNVNDMSYMLSDCESLKQLNLSNWNLNNANINGIFSAYSYSGCSNLNNIIINKSNYNSVNKVISQLPTRTTDTMGTLNIAGVDDISQVDITTAQSKYWNINTSIFILRTRTT